jgi:hypothetical protein
LVRVRVALLALSALALSGCITTSMQGYADRQLPDRPVQRIAVLVSAQGSLGPSLQTSISSEAKKRGLFAEDALLLLPPTRTYSNDEVKGALTKDGIDAVLVLTVGDTGVRKEYAGTIMTGNYSGTSSATGTGTRFGNMTNVSASGTSSGTMTATSTPTYRYSRQTAFQAKLIEVTSGRTLWVGGGQVQAGGLLFIGDGTNANSAASAIFEDMHSKGVIGIAAS